MRLVFFAVGLVMAGIVFSPWLPLVHDETTNVALNLLVKGLLSVAIGGAAVALIARRSQGAFRGAPPQ